jgi:multiple sugar transport system ATP-binding protein
MAEVVLKNVCKEFPGDGGHTVRAVRDFNLVVHDREFMVFVGPSGCGKSTTLRMIAGLEDITRGEISIDGRVVNNVPPKDRDIAMVFQNYALYPHMSVYENMAFSLRLRRFAKEEIRRRVHEAAEILGLGDYLDRKPKALSGGQRQRVALGRAIVRQPKVFLFDEPLSNLDAKMRVQMRGEITKLHQRLRATMIYVTHDQVEAMTMGDRIVVMDAVTNPETGLKEGEAQQIDRPLTIYHRPTNKFVAGFIGSPPMNFVTGRLVPEGARTIFREDDGGSITADLGPQPGLSALQHAAVTLGFRPEDCSILDPSAPEKSGLAVQVELVEPMGAETLYYLNTGAHTVICRTRGGGDHSREGQSVRLAIDPGALCLFDPARGDRAVELEPASVGH